MPLRFPRPTGPRCEMCGVEDGAMGYWDTAGVFHRDIGGEGWCVLRVGSDGLCPMCRANPDPYDVDNAKRLMWQRAENQRAEGE